MDKRFSGIIQLIQQSRINAIRVINSELINLYWNIGEYISNKIKKSEWGDSVVTELAKYIQLNEPEIKGFSDKNIWRMKQFYETYKVFPKLSTLLREISWSHNLAQWVFGNQVAINLPYLPYITFVNKKKRIERLKPSVFQSPITSIQ